MLHSEVSACWIEQKVQRLSYTILWTGSLEKIEIIVTRKVMWDSLIERQGHVGIPMDGGFM